jgi:outer membrane protein OmpA-like peptidoglycan-associated protein
MREDDNDFFALSQKNKEGKGSAAQLSKERAAIIKRYLQFKGIDKERMEIKGWGGKQMLYQKDDPNAKRNVRVEIEIVSE